MTDYDPEYDVVNVTIPGYGVYTVTRDAASALARSAEVLARMTEQLYPDAQLAIPLYLTDCGERKIACIKVIRQATGRNLKDSKNLADKVGSSSTRYKPHGDLTGQRALIGVFPHPVGLKLAQEFREAGCKVEFPSVLELLAKEGN